MSQAVRTKSGCIVARTLSGNSPAIIYIAEGRAAARSNPATAGGYIQGLVSDTETSTGYPRAGCMVYLNATRALECIPNDSTATGYDAKATRFAGLLLEDMTGVTTHLVAVAAATPDTVYETSITSETATTTATTSATLIGLGMHGSVNASRFFLDRTASTPSVTVGPWVVVGINETTEGTLNGRVQFVSRASLFK